MKLFLQVQSQHRFRRLTVSYVTVFSSKQDKNLSKSCRKLQVASIYSYSPKFLVSRRVDDTSRTSCQPHGLQKAAPAVEVPTCRRSPGSKLSGGGFSAICRKSFMGVSIVPEHWERFRCVHVEPHADAFIRNLKCVLHTSIAIRVTHECRSRNSEIRCWSVLWRVPEL
jgi:hypothetical protein